MLFIFCHFPADCLMVHPSRDTSQYTTSAPQSGCKMGSEGMHRQWMNSPKMHITFRQMVFSGHPITVCTHMSRYYTASDRSCSILWVLFYGASTRHCDLLNRHMFTPITPRLACKFNRDSHFLPLYRKDTAVQSGREKEETQVDQHLNCKTIDQQPISPYT